MTASTAASIKPEEAFERIGRITRQLHEAMSELGLQHSLHTIAQEFPDARDRLTHVGHMTEAAATKVLNLIDVGQPECRSFQQSSDRFHASLGEWQSPDPAHSPQMQGMLASCRAFGAEAGRFAAQQSQLLGEIMLTQDFQDLSGQVIKKVVDIIGQTERQLLDLLMHSAPEGLNLARPTSNELAGPQVPDKALKQDDVDDLLASLGF